MSSSDEDLMLACACYVAMKTLRDKQSKCKRKRPWWKTSRLYRDRSLHRRGTTLLREIRTEEALDARELFEKFCRMTPNMFNQFLAIIAPKIRNKEVTGFQKDISVQKKLTLTLRFLSTGDSLFLLAALFGISDLTVQSIILDVCAAIIEGLQDYIKLPKTREEWMSVARNYEEKWDFPHCLGAIDGKHIQLKAPSNCNSEYYSSYKNTFSVDLMTIVDADYNFLYADVGCQGRIPDGGIFHNTQFFEMLDRNKLNLPPAINLNGKQKPMPYVFVADETFPFRENIMKPYTKLHEKGNAVNMFNYRLSKAFQVVENTFGILLSVFGALQNPLFFEPEKSKIIVMACIYMHNFLRREKSSRDVYSPIDSFDREIDEHVIDGIWRQDVKNSCLLPIEKIKSEPRVAEEIRNEFLEYFSNI